jgi:hypothetical protein
VGITEGYGSGGIGETRSPDTVGGTGIEDGRLAGELEAVFALNGAGLVAKLGSPAVAHLDTVIRFDQIGTIFSGHMNLKNR